jgi:hypothetical protein
MRTIAMAVVVGALSGVLVGWRAPAWQNGAAENERESARPQRVILVVNRTLEVPGYLALEDDDVIAVRDLKGQVQSFAKPRITQIVRLVDPRPGQEGMVILRDGQVREGVIIEDTFEHVLIDIHGIRAKLKRDTVSHVVLQPTFEEKYAEYKASLQPGMFDAHFGLCQWLFERRRYELAHQELMELLEQVEMPEARKLLRLVEAQVALKEKPPRDEPTGEQSPPDSAAPSAAHSSDDDSPVESTLGPLLTKADVNIIRVYEIDFDHPPKITITPDTIRELIEKYGENKLVPASQTGRNAMFRAAADEPLEIVRLMFELRARDLYPQIQVNSEPRALNLFRQRVHDTWLMNNCATSRCHGGPESGALFLHRRHNKEETVRYTNFLILERLKLDSNWPLINFDRPEDSLIIQYGLSRDDPSCRKPHPRVPGWKHAFSPTNPRMKHDAVEWIRSMMQPRPDYPVNYQPPQRKPPAEPAPSNDSQPSR